MRNSYNEQFEDAQINAAAAKITEKLAALCLMSDSDPNKVVQRRILNAMRYDQSAALMLRSMRSNDSVPLAFSYEQPTYTHSKSGN